MTVYDVEDFVQRSGLEERVLGTLAEAGAFEGFRVDRRNALWDTRRFARTRSQSLSLADREGSPRFDSSSSFEDVTWDYRTTAHSPRGHPLEPMRAILFQQGLPDARTVAAMKNGAAFATRAWSSAGSAPAPPAELFS